MVCFQDHSRFISLQSLFTLAYVPLISSHAWSIRTTSFLDWFSKVLLAMKLTFITRAIMESLSVGIWPTNVGSQIWLVLICIIFYLSCIRMLMASTLEAVVALVTFFIGLSFFGSIYQSFDESIKDLYQHIFSSELSDVGSICIALAVLVLMGSVIAVIQYKGWIHTVVIGLLVAVDITLSSHIVIYNADWRFKETWMTSEVCCSIPDIELQIHMDGNLCPVRFTLYDIMVFGVMLILYVPVQFYRREQCTPMWFCCRARARALEGYRKQKSKRMYGMKEYQQANTVDNVLGDPDTPSMVDEDEDDENEDHGKEEDTNRVYTHTRLYDARPTVKTVNREPDS